MTTHSHQGGESGQALLLGVVALLALSIGMYTSYNLSRSVYEKIKLQNAADSAAYSVATLEARTFNFIAFANRAQVAHYVQMLEAQSLLSSATFVEGYTGWGGEMSHSMGENLKNTYRILCIATLGAGCAPFQWIDTMGDTLKSLGQALHQSYQGTLRPAVDSMDAFVPRYLSLMTSKNQALFAASLMFAVATSTQVTQGGADIALRTDPGARTTGTLTALLNTYNAALYLGAFDFASFNPNASGQANTQARVLMSELVNATRAGGAKSDFLISRKPFEWLQEFASSMSGSGTNGASKVAEKVAPLLEMLAGPNFVGTSKLVSERGGQPAALADTGSHQFNGSDLAAGAALVAKDQARAFGWDPFASVISGRQEGQHCRYEATTSHWGKWFRLPSILEGDRFKCDSDHGRKHLWNDLLNISGGGLQPYLKFSPEPSLLASAQSFNQPDVWVWLNKPAESMSLLGDVSDLKFSMSRPQEQWSFDGDFDSGQTLLPAGMNALARAQVYYHRPGAWREPPNFFNPYWGARLAPKSQGIDRLLEQLPLPSVVSDWVSDQMWMH
jgi:hypothetical protein